MCVECAASYFFAVHFPRILRCAVVTLRFREDVFICRISSYGTVYTYHSPPRSYSHITLTHKDCGTAVAESFTGDAPEGRGSKNDNVRHLHTTNKSRGQKLKFTWLIHVYERACFVRELNFSHWISRCAKQSNIVCTCNARKESKSPHMKNFRKGESARTDSAGLFPVS